MITLDDCIALCGLSEDEVLAIAEHEHIPEIAAVELGGYLLLSEKGSHTIATMISDDIRCSMAMGERAHAITLLHVLHEFLRKHPEASSSVMHP